MSSINTNSTVSMGSIYDSSEHPEIVFSLQNKMAHPDRPIQPDLSFLGTNIGNMILSGYLSVNKYEGWNLLANFNPDPNREESFMFCNNPSIQKLMNSVNENYNGHSGASLGTTMRHLEYIAKHGYTKYRELFYTNVISTTA